MQRCQYPIHYVTKVPLKLCVIKNELDINVHNFIFNCLF